MGCDQNYVSKQAALAERWMLSAQESDEVVQRSEVEGKIVLLFHTYCFHPFVNMVFYLQNMGAVGVIYINRNETFYTMTEVRAGRTRCR